MTSIRGVEDTGTLGEGTRITLKLVLAVVGALLYVTLLYGAFTAKVAVVETDLANVKVTVGANREQLEKQFDVNSAGIDRRLDRIETKVDQILQRAARVNEGRAR